MRISVRHKKFLVAISNENLFVDPVTKGTFLGMSDYLKKHNPCCDFCGAHRYQKINKNQRAVSCEADESLDSGSKWLLYLSADSRL
jgi:hypothetical protein